VGNLSIASKNKNATLSFYWCSKQFRIYSCKKCETGLQKLAHPDDCWPARCTTETSEQFYTISLYREKTARQHYDTVSAKKSTLMLKPIQQSSRQYYSLLTMKIAHNILSIFSCSQLLHEIKLKKILLQNNALLLRVRNLLIKNKVTKK